tara:strand:- start:283 stop:525 length:243 start_codon:yes stop_codon:yes gene_type:complete
MSYILNITTWDGTHTTSIELTPSEITGLRTHLNSILGSVVTEPISVSLDDGSELTLEVEDDFTDRSYPQAELTSDPERPR